MYKFVDENKQHLHTFNGKTLIGTSTASKMASGDMGGALAWWASELAAVEALSTEAYYPDLRKEFEEAKALKVKDYKKGKYALYALQKKYPEFKKARYAHYDSKNKSAVTGTGMHERLEKYVLKCMEKGGKPLKFSDTEYPAVTDFAKWSMENVEKFIYSEAYCYSEKLWVGGIVDCGAIMKDGRYAVIDFKSSKDAYFNQFVQTALYDVQIAENGTFTKDGESVLEPMKADTYIIIPFGTHEFTIKEREDVEKFRETAVACLQVYKHSQNYKGLIDYG